MIDWVKRFEKVTEHMTLARKREVLESMKAAWDRGETAQSRMHSHDDHFATASDTSEGIHTRADGYNWSWGTDWATAYAETMRATVIVDGSPWIKTSLDNLGDPPNMRRVSEPFSETLAQPNIKLVFWPTIEYRCACMRRDWRRQGREWIG